MGMDAGALGAFAKAYDLQPVGKPDLPQHGDTLSHPSAEAGPGVAGELPGGLEGTLTHFDYTTTDSAHHTHHLPMTSASSSQTARSSSRATTKSPTSVNSGSSARTPRTSPPRSAPKPSRKPRPAGPSARRRRRSRRPTTQWSRQRSRSSAQTTTS